MTRIKTSKITPEAENPRLPDIDEEALIRKAQAGDKDAYGVISNHYRRGVTGQVRLLLNRNNNVEDMVQEIFWKAWKGIESFRGESKFSSWLYRIASNHCLTYLRCSSREAARCDSIEELEERQKQTKRFVAKESAGDSLAKREMLEKAKLLYKKLKDPDKRIFEMVVKGKERAEIATELGQTRGHVDYVVGRLLDKLTAAAYGHTSRKYPVVRAEANKISGPGKMGAVGF